MILINVGSYFVKEHHVCSPNPRCPALRATPACATTSVGFQAFTQHSGSGIVLNLFIGEKLVLSVQKFNV